jgi:hypothetical protein
LAADSQPVQVTRCKKKLKEDKRKIESQELTNASFLGTAVR